MATCFVVPGLLESELSGPFPIPGTIWPAPTALILGQIGGLRLAANGIDPQPPDGVACVATGPLVPYVGLPTFQLGSSLGQRGYRTELFTYDWRKTMLPIGEQLAERVRATSSAADPCVIVGHSHGGIISRVAWASLVASEETDKVRRIISLGTAHAGSYAAVAALSGDSSAIDGLLSWNQTIGNIAWGALAYVGYRRWTRAELVELAATWPALYEVMPVVGAWDAADDPERPKIFDAENWTGTLAPPQSWLTHAREVIGPLMRSEATRPPSHVMTSVAGTTFSAANRLTDAALLGRSGALGYTSESDGVVTVASALLPGSKEITVYCTHQDLFPQLVNSGELVRWIVEERSPTPIPPPPEENTSARIPLLPTIPGVVNASSSTLPAECLQGRCSC